MLKSSVALPVVTVKLLAEVVVPLEVVTVTLPVVVPVATVAVIWVALFTVKAEAVWPLNATDDTPLKLVPVIKTAVPTGPLPGFNAEMVGGGGLTVKLLLERALPTGVVTVILPVVVPLATMAVIWVVLLTVKLAAAVELKFTELVPVKFVPVIVTEVPATPLVGVKPEIVGGSVTVKLAAEVAVPPAVVTVILPVVEPLATKAVTWVALSTEKVPAAFPLNFTAVAPVKFVPTRTTVVPVDPEVGAKLATAGAGGSFGPPFEAALPQAAKTRTSVAQSKASAHRRA
jgi:hypothetical protein